LHCTLQFSKRVVTKTVSRMKILSTLSVISFWSWGVIKQTKLLSNQAILTFNITVWPYVVLRLANHVICNNQLRKIPFVHVAINGCKWRYFASVFKHIYCHPVFQFRRRRPSKTRRILCKILQLQRVGDCYVVIIYVCNEITAGNEN